MINLTGVVAVSNDSFLAIGIQASRPSHRWIGQSASPVSSTKLDE
jgi:hypothetical protein